MQFFTVCHLVILACVMAMEAVRESNYLLLGCKSDSELSDFISRFVIREKQRFRVVHLDSGISVAEVEQNSVLHPQPFNVLSTHRVTGGRAEKLRTLLHYLNFGPLSGVLCDLVCDDERHEQMKGLQVTGAINRAGRSPFARFKQQGCTNYLHIGDAFTFWNHPVKEREDHRMIRYIFSHLPPVRLLDTIWIYSRAESEGKCALGSSRGSGSEYESCLSHALAAELFPWDLFVLGLRTKDAPLLHYITDELPEYHHQILTAQFTELPKILEVEAKGNYQWRYAQNYVCRLSQPYHKSYESIVSVNQRRFNLANRLEAEQIMAKNKLAPLKEKEAQLLADLDIVSESNASDAAARSNLICNEIDKVAKEILETEKSLMEITAVVQEQLKDLKEEEASYYYID